MDHVRELQGRLFAVAITFIVFSAAAYPFFDRIANFLLAPLGKDHELVYLTPGGAFSFIIQVCMYVGFVVALPVVIYHVYRFIMPVMNKVTLKMAILYTAMSFVLAIAGMLFAYYVSLPAALYFLTSFNLYHINPMLTIDSYFSFIMTYMLVGALLFQIPLLMLLINGVTPLKPKQLMQHQGKILLGSFIVAALVSPTPDALNQILLASPMVVMYQVGVVLVWLKNRRRHEDVVAPQPAKETTVSLKQVPTPVHAAQLPHKVINDVNFTSSARSTARPMNSGRSIDGFVIRSGVTQRPAPRLSRPAQTVVERQLHVYRPSSHQQVRRSLDGFPVS